MIPAELKKLKKWMYCESKNNAPADLNGKIVSYLDEKNYFTYSELQKNKEHIFVLKSDYVCIDFDSCLDNEGNIIDWAKEFVEPFLGNGFYVEYSRSKTGLHVIAKGKIDGNISVKINKIHKKYSSLNPKSGIEIFTNHAITLTGNTYNNNQPEQIKNISIDFKNLYNFLAELKKRNLQKMQRYNNSGDLFNYIKTQVTLKQIFAYYGIEYNDRKNISCPLPGHKDNKPSFKISGTQDLFYCFAGCGGGTVIDFVMKMENLNSLDAAKWIQDKFNLEIEEGNCVIKTNEKSGYTIEIIDLQKIKKTPEEKIEIMNNIYIKEILKQGAILPLGMTELTWIIEDVDEKTGKIKVHINTGYLAKFLRENIKYIFVRESAKEGIQRFIYKNGVYNLSSDFDFRGMIKKYIPESILKMGQVNEVKENLYTDDRYVSYSELNPEKYINFQDGLLNIDTWKLEKHTSDILTTIQLPNKYPKIFFKPENSIFDKYLDYLTENDESKKLLILQFMGVSLSNIYGHRMKKSLFMVGPHDTGKSKIKELLIKLIGEHNANTLDLETLEARFGSSNIFNKRLIGSNDMSFMKVKELKVFKLLTGGDTLFMENKGENGFNAKFNGVAWFCCNDLPKFGGDKGDGVYKRFAIIECNKTPIPEEKQNKKLLEDMFIEKDYIIYLALRALKKVIDNNYNYDIPQSSIDALQSYKVDNDSFATFFNECCKERYNKDKIQDECSRAILFKVYNAWCKDNNNGYHYSKSECIKYLESIGMDELVKTKGTYYFKNFTITQEIKKDYKQIYGFDTV